MVDTSEQSGVNFMSDHGKKDKNLNFINNYYTENQNNILKKVFLFIPCLIGKLFLMITWLLPPCNRNNTKEKIEYEKICLVGFKFFLIYSSYFVILFVFVKLLMINLFCLNGLYYKLTNFLFSLGINCVLLVVAKIFIIKQNLNKIQNKLDADEQVVYKVSPVTFTELFLIPYVAFSSCMIMRCFAEMRGFLYCIPIFIVYYVFSSLIFYYFLNTTVITNKRIITERFFKSLSQLSYSYEKLKEIKDKYPKAIGFNFIGLNFVKNDISFSDIASVDIKILRRTEEIILNMKNGLKLVLHDNDIYTAKDKIKLK